LVKFTGSESSNLEFKSWQCHLPLTDYYLGQVT
jgi:hypothetical protein